VLVLDNDFGLKETIYLEKYFFKQPGDIGYSQAEASAENVFSSSDGNKIIILSKSMPNYSTKWGIEIIETQNK
jgi:hypothetical protein